MQSLRLDREVRHEEEQRGKKTRAKRRGEMVGGTEVIDNSEKFRRREDKRKRMIKKK